MKTFEILDANWDSNAWSPARLFQCETPTVPDIFRTLKVPSMILKTFDNIKKQVRDRLDQCRCFAVVDLINIFSKMSQKNVKKKYSANRTNKLLAESFRWKKHFARLPNFNEIPSNFESKLSPLSKLCKSRKSYPHNVRESLSLLFAWIIYRFFGLNVGPTDPERLWGQRKPWKICHSLDHSEREWRWPPKGKRPMRVYTQKEIWFCCRLTILNYPLSGGDETSVATHPFATPPWPTCFPIRGWTQREFMNARYSGTNRG